MARTVDEGFNRFLSWLTPTGTESSNAKSHRASIDSRLKADFGMRRFFRTGSFGNGTSISAFSDVDYFANIPTEKLKQDSRSTLLEIKRALDNRFPNTGVYIDSPAVVVPFGNDRAETTEVVPADFIDRKYDCSTYHIPDGTGGWMKASPEWHKLYIDNINNGLKDKVKPLIRFIKAWKYYNGVPISSFYLEMYVGIYAKAETSIVYSIDINRILKRLQTTALVPMSDPMAISGLISPCKDEADRLKALSELSDAVNRSTRAWTAEKEGRIQDAFYWWNKVYSNGFPSY